MKRLRCCFGITLIIALASIATADGIINFAPFVYEVPDVVVGDAENATSSNVFVFPDAFNLNTLVADDLTSPAGIIWSYSESGDNMYTINGAQRSDPETDDLVNPAADKRIDTQWDPRDPTTGTLGARTVTIRDESRSPVAIDDGRTTTYSPADCTDSYTQAYKSSRVITLYASDGSSVSLANAQSFIVYTLDNGQDTYSGDWPHLVIFQWPPAGLVPSGWSYANETGASAQTVGEQGLCISVGTTGDNDANWHGSYGDITITANSVFEARVTVTTSQTSAFQQPMWCLQYDNYSDTGRGQNEYGGESFFMDNENGANSAIRGAGRAYPHNFRVWMMPIAEQTPQFASSTSGFLAPMFDASNDMRLVLRVMDYGSSSYGAASDSGAICWKDLQVLKHDLSSMVVESTEMNVTAFTNGATDSQLTPSSWLCEGLSMPGYDMSTITYGTTGSTIAPVSHWNTACMLTFRPGDTYAYLYNDSPSWLYSLADNYPIVWEPDLLYYIEFELKSINATSEWNPPDVIRIGADALTWELVSQSWIVPNTPDPTVGAPYLCRGVSMPRVGAPQKYGTFFYTHSVTKSGMGEDAKRWRPRLDIMCSKDIKPNGRKTNTGGITITGMKVQKVHFPN